MILEIGKEYEYLGQWVKLIEIHGDGPGRECVIETRSAQRTIVSESELSEKPPRPKKPKPTALYLLQNVGAGYVGNSPVFWSEKGGYTQWIDEAKRWTYREGWMQIRATKGSHEWRLWPLELIERCAQRTVDIQRLQAAKAGGE